MTFPLDIFEAPILPFSVIASSTTPIGRAIKMDPNPWANPAHHRFKMCWAKKGENTIDCKT